MPRLVHTVPKCQKHRASGQAVVTLDGRDYYLGPYGSPASRALYDRLTSEWLLNGRSLHPLGGAATTVVELCARFLCFAEGYYVKDGRPTGATAGVKATIKYLRTWYGRELAANFGPLALKALRQRMVDDGLSQRYVNDHVARIKRMFKWAVSEELVPSATHQALTTVTGLLRGRTNARETPPVRPVDDAVVAATLPCLPEIVADMVRLQRLTGMRPAEVCIVRPCDIDRTADVWLYRPSSHKTEHHGRERVVFLGGEAQEVLVKHLVRDASAYCFQPRDSEAKRRAAAFAARRTPLHYGNRPGTNRRRRPKTQPGERYNATSYRKAIARACDKAFPHPALGCRPENELSVAERDELASWRRAHHSRSANTAMKLQPAQPAANVDDVLWCYARLDDPRAQPATAPSAGAWGLLAWAREERNRFYTGVFPRALLAQVKARNPPNGCFPTDEPTREEVLEAFGDFEVEKTWLRRRGVSDELIADAEGLVADWADEVSVELSPECACALVSGVAEVVQGAIEAATKHPAAFARYAVGPGDDQQSTGDPSGLGF